VGGLLAPAGTKRNAKFKIMEMAGLGRVELPARSLKNLAPFANRAKDAAPRAVYY